MGFFPRHPVNRDFCPQPKSLHSQEGKNEFLLSLLALCICLVFSIATASEDPENSSVKIGMAAKGAQHPFARCEYVSMNMACK